MKKKDTLIFEYAKLAALNLAQGQRSVNERMRKIEEELQMTAQTIIRKATEMSLKTFK